MIARRTPSGRRAVAPVSGPDPGRVLPVTPGLMRWSHVGQHRTRTRPIHRRPAGLRRRPAAGPLYDAGGKLGATGTTRPVARGGAVDGRAGVGGDVGSVPRRVLTPPAEPGD